MQLFLLPMNWLKEMTNKDKCDSTKTKAGFFSRLTFGWLTATVDLGNRQTLEQDNLGPILDLHSTEVLVSKLECGWLAEVQRCSHNTNKPRLWRVVSQVLENSEYLYIFFLCLLKSCSRIFKPVFLSLLLSEMLLGSLSSQVWLSLFAAGLCACSFVQAVSKSHYLYRTFLATVHVKAAITGLVYKKVNVCHLLIYCVWSY